VCGDSASPLVQGAVRSPLPLCQQLFLGGSVQHHSKQAGPVKHCPLCAVGAQEDLAEVSHVLLCLGAPNYV
jgi:hypothetical protein